MANNKKTKKTQFAVLGLGRFGAQIAQSLYANGGEVLAVDISEEKTAAVAEFATHVVTADVSDEAVLKQLEIADFDTVIVAIGENVQTSIICSFICKELGCKHIVAKARDPRHANILQKIGVDEIIIPEADSAKKAAAKLLNPNIHDLMELADGYSVAEFNIPDSWAGKSLKDLMLPSRFGVNVLIIINPSNKVLTISGETVLSQNDKIVVGGTTEDIGQLSDEITKLA
jgi:trk system potassium uptake protein TrkA